MVNAIQVCHVGYLVRKPDYNTNISEIKKKLDYAHSKYITTEEFDKLAADNIAARLAPANLATKTDVVDFVKETDFDNNLKNINEKVISNKAKHLEAKKKLTGLTNKVEQISENRQKILLDRMYFTGDNGS